MARKSVADKNEALKSITQIMRGDEIKTADKMKAAEYIVKYGGENAGITAAADSAATPDIMIVDDIPPDSGG